MGDGPLAISRHDYPAVIVQFETVQPSRTESVKPSGGCQGSACVLSAIILR